MKDSTKNTTKYLRGKRMAREKTEGDKKISEKTPSKKRTSHAIVKQFVDSHSDKEWLINVVYCDGAKISLYILKCFIEEYPDVFMTYNDLCYLLGGINKKHSTYKESFLKELRNYVKFRINDNKYHISSVKEDAKINIVSRKNNKYVDLVLKIFIEDLIVRVNMMNMNELVCFKSQLYHHLGFINKRAIGSAYAFNDKGGRIFKPEAMRIIMEDVPFKSEDILTVADEDYISDIIKIAYFEYTQYTYHVFSNILKNVFNILKSKGVVTFYNVINCYIGEDKETDTCILRKPSDDMNELSYKLAFYVASQMKYKSITELQIILKKELYQVRRFNRAYRQQYEIKYGKSIYRGLCFEFTPDAKNNRFCVNSEMTKSTNTKRARKKLNSLICEAILNYGRKRIQSDYSNMYNKLLEEYVGREEYIKYDPRMCFDYKLKLLEYFVKELNDIKNEDKETGLNLNYNATTLEDMLKPRAKMRVLCSTNKEDNEYVSEIVDGKLIFNEPEDFFTSDKYAYYEKDGIARIKEFAEYEVSNKHYEYK